MNTLNTRKSIIIVLVILVTLSMLLTACGDDTKVDGSIPAPTPYASIVEPMQALNACIDQANGDALALAKCGLDQ